MPDNLQTGNEPPANPPATGETLATPTPAPAGDPPAPQPVADPNAPVYAPGAPGIPTYLQGKSPTEVAQLVAQMGDALATGQNMPVGQPDPYAPAPAQPVYQAPQAPAAPLVPPNADMWISQPDVAAAQYGAYQEQRLTAQVQPTLDRNAQQNASMARQLAVQSDADAFGRWGPEIDMAIQSMAVENRTFDMYQQAVQLVRGRHSNELVAERAETLVQERIKEMQEAGTLRSGAAGVGATALPGNVLDLKAEDIDPEIQESFHHANIDQHTIDEFLQTRRPYGNVSLEVARTKYQEALKSNTAGTAPVT